MKKLTFFALMLLAGASLFTSCKKDDTNAAATISVSNNKTAYTIYTLGTADTTITFVVTVKADAKIETYTMTRATGSGSASYPGGVNDIGVAASGYSGETSYSYTFNEDFKNTETYPITYKFSVTDKDGNTADVSVVISKHGSTAAGAIYTISTQTLGASGNVAGSFLDLTTTGGASVLNQTAANASPSTVDIVYYYGSSNNATLCAPNDVTVNGGSGNLSLCATWGAANESATLFGTTTITASQFDAMTDDSGISGLTPADTKEIYLDGNMGTADPTGTVLSFKTAAGKKGLIKITGLSSHDNTGTISFALKVQQ